MVRIGKPILVGIGLVGTILLLSFLRRCSLDPTSGFDIFYGFAESNFFLAQDSRLPRWFRLPAGLGRSDVSVEFICFLYRTKVVVRNNNSVLFSVTAQQRKHPITEARSIETGQEWPCPSYISLSVNGIEEIIAHIEKGDIVYIVEPSEINPEIYSDKRIQQRCSQIKYYHAAY